MKKRRYTRQVAAAKSLSPENMKRRFQFASSHLHWEKDDWMRILRTDETWLTGGHHSRCWVTRSVLLAIIQQVETVILSLSPKVGEVFDTKYVVENVRKRIGWMFWGSFLEEKKALVWFGRRSGTLSQQPPTVRE
ncbi:hypothetical protein K3495_g13111 [Podosphaera aphanis]|nr:hypothetical protein K3495_g13111 [Podosphaera aphanis]